MVSRLNKTLNDHCLISGEKATTLAQLPPIWQAIAVVGHSPQPEWLSY